MNARTIHPFPARMAPEIAMEYLPELATTSSLRVLDPMCGSGTVLTEASRRSHSAIGFDMDPLAVLMTNVATAPLDVGEFENAVACVVATAKTFPTETPWGADDVETTQFAKYWFAEEQRKALAQLTASIGQIEESGAKRAMQIALSRIIVTKAPKASLAADTSHSRPHRVRETSSFDVHAGFASSARSLARLLRDRSLKGTASASLGDARDLVAVEERSIDLAISSPPYLNALDYLRGHKMSLIWLGYSIPELRRIRSDSIGAERGLTDDPSDWEASIVGWVKDQAIDATKLPIPAITRYVRDLGLMSRELFNKMKPGGRVVMVLGNSTLRGNYIANDVISQEALKQAGFQIESRIEREIPEGHRYLPTKTVSSLQKRMRTEVVISARAS